MSFKYRWQREISPPAEKFDLDREEKTMKNDDQKTPQVDDLPEDDEGFTACPMCGSSQLEYKGEAYDDEHHEGSAWRCLECDYSFTDRTD